MFFKQTSYSTNHGIEVVARKRLDVQSVTEYYFSSVGYCNLSGQKLHVIQNRIDQLIPSINDVIYVPCFLCEKEDDDNFFMVDDTSVKAVSFDNIVLKWLSRDNQKIYDLLIGYSADFCPYYLGESNYTNDRFETIPVLNERNKNSTPLVTYLG